MAINKVVVLVLLLGIVACSPAPHTVPAPIVTLPVDPPPVIELPLENPKVESPTIYLYQDRVDRINTYSFTTDSRTVYVRTTDNAQVHVFSDGFKAEDENYDRALLTNGKAKGWCVSWACSPHRYNKPFDIDPTLVAILTPTQLIKEAVIGNIHPSKTKQIERKNTILIEFSYNNENGTMWVDTYTGLPLEYTLQKVYKFRDLATNPVGAPPFSTP